jgi:2-polyprenyl-3-methyl-5-hydroxy-6-metoxy-1,4-benzoquinol methylase
VTQPAERIDGVETARYDFEGIDLASGSTHADVVLLVGENRRVLELGPATGYMSRAFAQRGCRVVGIEVDPTMAGQAAEHLARLIVGDLDELDLEAELADERFDVIVAADVLEHLRDPLAVLTRLTPFLAENGFVVLSVPNIAHGSVRLALLEGRFEYRELGLLDRTHVTFFTRQSLEEMLDEAELGIAAFHRHELDLAASEVPFDPAAVPEDVRRRLDEDPDARTYQFVVKAFPMGRGGLRELQRRMSEQALAHTDAERARDAALRENEQLRAAVDRLEQQLRELSAALAQITGREGELRRGLIEAHDQLLRRDAEIEDARREAAGARHDAALLRADVDRLEELGRGDRAWSAEQAAALERQQRELNALRARPSLRGLARRGLRYARSLPTRA